MSQAGNSVKNQQNLPINNSKQTSIISKHIPSLVNISIDIYSSYHPDRKIGQTDRCMAGGQTEEQTDTDDQYDNIIFHHYHVLRYKKVKKIYINNPNLLYHYFSNLLP